MAQIPTVYDPSKVNTNHESFPPPQAVQTSSPPAAQIQSNTQSESTTSNTFNYQTSHSTPLNFLKSGIGILSVFIVVSKFYHFNQTKILRCMIKTKQLNLVVLFVNVKKFYFNIDSYICRMILSFKSVEKINETIRYKVYLNYQG